MGKPLWFASWVALATGDKMQLSKVMNIVYEAMKQAGRKPKGRKREFVAKKLTISPTHIRMLNYIERHFMNPWKAEINEGSIVVAHMPAENQQLVFKAFR